MPDRLPRMCNMQSGFFKGDSTTAQSSLVNPSFLREAGSQNTACLHF